MLFLWVFTGVVFQLTDSFTVAQSSIIKEKTIALRAAAQASFSSSSKSELRAQVWSVAISVLTPPWVSPPSGIGECCLEAQTLLVEWVHCLQLLKPLSDSENYTIGASAEGLLSSVLHNVSEYPAMFVKNMFHTLVALEVNVVELPTKCLDKILETYQALELTLRADALSLAVLMLKRGPGNFLTSDEASSYSQSLKSITALVPHLPVLDQCDLWAELEGLVPIPLHEQLMLPAFSKALTTCSTAQFIYVLSSVISTKGVTPPLEWMQTLCRRCCLDNADEHHRDLVRLLANLIPRLQPDLVGRLGMAEVFQMSVFDSRTVAELKLLLLGSLVDDGYLNTSEDILLQQAEHLAGPVIDHRDCAGCIGTLLVCLAWIGRPISSKLEKGLFRLVQDIFVQHPEDSHLVVKLVEELSTSSKMRQAQQLAELLVSQFIRSVCTDAQRRTSHMGVLICAAKLSKVDPMIVTDFIRSIMEHDELASSDWLFFNQCLELCETIVQQFPSRTVRFAINRLLCYISLRGGSLMMRLQAGQMARCISSSSFPAVLGPKSPGSRLKSGHDRYDPEPRPCPQILKLAIVGRQHDVTCGSVHLLGSVTHWDYICRLINHGSCSVERALEIRFVDGVPRDHPNLVHLYGVHVRFSTRVQCTVLDHTAPFLSAVDGEHPTSWNTIPLCLELDSPGPVQLNLQVIFHDLHGNHWITQSTPMTVTLLEMLQPLPELVADCCDDFKQWGAELVSTLWRSSPESLAAMFPGAHFVLSFKHLGMDRTDYETCTQALAELTVSQDNNTTLVAAYVPPRQLLFLRLLWTKQGACAWLLTTGQGLLKYLDDLFGSILQAES